MAASQRQKHRRHDDPRASMQADFEQIFVAGDDIISPRRRGAFKYGVIVRIAAHDLE
jgi:hypothetical protein